MGSMNAVRDREKVVSGIKSIETLIFKETQMFDNFILRHMALESEIAPAALAHKVQR